MPNKMPVTVLVLMWLIIK